MRLALAPLLRAYFSLCPTRAGPVQTSADNALLDAKNRAALDEKKIAELNEQIEQLKKVGLCLGCCGGDACLLLLLLCA